MSPSSPWPHHRGWLVVLGAFLVMLVGFGAIYSSSAFAPEIGVSLGLERGDAAMVLALSSSATFFVSAISGPLSDRVGPRPLAVFGTLLIALGLAIAAAAKDAASFFASYGLLVGIGVGLAYVPAVAAVQRWFLANRGLASGIALSGIGVGTALIPLLKLILADFGDWRFAFLICAVLAAVVGVAGSLLLEAKPESHGMGPDGTRLRAKQSAAKDDGPTLSEALRSRGFLLAYAGTLLVAIPAAAPLMLLVGTAEARGLSHQQAVALLGLMGVGTIIGRFCLAALADLLGRRLVFLLSCLGVSIAMMLWVLADGATSLQGFALIYGALQGGFVALLPVFVADSFGSRSVGGIVGLLYTSRGLALLLGVPLVGMSVAALGAHDLPVALCGLVGMLGTLLLALARPEPRKGSPRHKSAEAPEAPEAFTAAPQPIHILRRKSAVLAMHRGAAMRIKLLRALALCLALAAPPFAAAQTLREGTPETLASFPLPPIADRPFVLQFSGTVALFSLPDAPAPKTRSAVLILQDALGADGRAVPYIENLLGAGIAVLELRDTSAEAAHAAMAMLGTDPRFQSSRLGVLGFGQGARVALGLPGPAARALLYPGCASLAVPPAASGTIMLVHGAEDPANLAEACARFCAALREAGVEATQREIPGAGYAWDYPALGEAQAALLPAAGGAERLPVRPWPAMAAQSAAEIAGFFAQHFDQGAP